MPDGLSVAFVGLISDTRAPCNKNQLAKSEGDVLDGERTRICINGARHLAHIGDYRDDIVGTTQARVPPVKSKFSMFATVFDVPFYDAVGEAEQELYWTS